MLRPSVRPIRDYRMQTHSLFFHPRLERNTVSRLIEYDESCRIPTCQFQHVACFIALQTSAYSLVVIINFIKLLAASFCDARFNILKLSSFGF